LGDVGVEDDGDGSQSASTFTLEGVDPIDSGENLSPGYGGGARAWCVRFWFVDVVQAGLGGWVAGDDFGPPFWIGSEDSAVTNLMAPRMRDEPWEPSKQLNGLEDDMGGFAAGFSKLDGDGPVGSFWELCVGEWGSCRVTTEPRSPLFIAGADVNTGMNGETEGVPCGGSFVRTRRRARHSVLVDTGESRGFVDDALIPSVERRQLGRVVIVVCSDEPATFEALGKAARHGFGHRDHVELGRGG
jgi:hypothetical protein